MEGESAWSERSFARNWAQVTMELGRHQWATLQWNRTDSLSNRGSPFHHPSSSLSVMNTLSEDGIKMPDRGVVR